MRRRRVIASIKEIELEGNGFSELLLIPGASESGAVDASKGLCVHKVLYRGHIPVYSNVQEKKIMFLE